MGSRHSNIVRVCLLLWMLVASLGLAVAALLFLLAAVQLALPEVVILDVESGDLLASLGFFALTGGLCVWLIVYGRRFRARLTRTPETPPSNHDEGPLPWRKP